jgi:SAM-dependent methyltransferase
MLKSHNKTIFEILGRGPIHPFPARMAPGIALEALGEGLSNLNVLDPMAGSGTVLAVARAKGHHAFGTDLDPLAVLLARVWTREIDTDQVRAEANEVLNRARVAFRRLPTGTAYPVNSDHETREFIRFWFDDYSRRQLTALAREISEIRDVGTQDALWCAFSRLIITKQAGASLAMDLSHSRPHRKFSRAPIKPLKQFKSAMNTVVSNCLSAGATTAGPPADVKQGDARQIDIGSDSIDLVLTSPPYLNAIDYMRCSKFSLVWMGHNIEELRRIRKNSIGAEITSEQALGADWVRSAICHLKPRPALSKRHHGMLAKYIWDIGRALAETTRVLRHGGRAVYVVGDSMISGAFVRNSMIVSALAQYHGLSLASRHSRCLPANRRYLPPPQRGRSKKEMNARMRREVVIAFTKD